MASDAVSVQWQETSRLSEELCHCDLHMVGMMRSEQWRCVNKLHHLWHRIWMYSDVWRDEDELSLFCLLCLIHKIFLIYFLRIFCIKKIFWMFFNYNCSKDSFLKSKFFNCYFLLLRNTFNNVLYLKSTFKNVTNLRILLYSQTTFLANVYFFLKIVLKSKLSYEWNY